MNKMMWILIGVLSTILLVSSVAIITAQLNSSSENEEINRNATLGRYNLRRIADFSQADVLVSRIFLGEERIRIVSFNKTLVIGSNLRVRGNLTVRDELIVQETLIVRENLRVQNNLIVRGCIRYGNPVTVLGTCL